MADQPKVDNLLHISWCDSMWVPHLNAGNVLDYFSERSNPFYSRDCNNEFIKMQQNARIDALTQMQGSEYMLLHAQDPILYIVRKQQRYSPTHVAPLGAFHIINGQVFQTPDIGSVINSRLASAMTQLNSSFSELSSYSQYHPTKDYWWHFQNKPQHQVQEATAKQNKDKKEEPPTKFQRLRVEALLTDLTSRFPYKPPPPLPEEMNAAVQPNPATSAATGQSSSSGPASAAPTAPTTTSSTTAAALPTTASPPLNVKIDDIKQEERSDSRADVKMEIKQEVKSEVKIEPHSLQQQQHFQRGTKPPPEKRPRFS